MSEFSVWERAKWIWISGLLIILSLSTLTVYLQFSRRQLKQARESRLQLSGLLINAQEMEQTTGVAISLDVNSTGLAY